MASLAERRRIVEARLRLRGSDIEGTAARYLDLDAETLNVLEAMQDDDDGSNVIPLRNLGFPEGEDDDEDDDRDDKDDKDEDDPHEEPDDDEPVIDEDTTVSSPAKWTPVPTKLARQFVKSHPEAAIQVEFPTVYEEDRSAKLKDLGTAQALGAISHRRMSEMMAKELGVDPYSYPDEMDQIKEENPPIDPAKNLGSGDKVIAGMLGPLAGTPPKAAGGGGGGFPAPARPDVGGGFPGGDVGAPSPFGGPPSGTAGERGEDTATPLGVRGPAPVTGRDPGFATPEDGGKRTQLSGPVQAEFRRQQRQVEAMERRIESMLRQLKEAKESLVRLTESERREPVIVNLQPHVNVEPPRVRVNVEKGDRPIVNVQPPDVTVNVPPQKAPVVNVEVQAPEPRTMRYERDSKGAIIRAVPEE